MNRSDESIVLKKLSQDVHEVIDRDPKLLGPDLVAKAELILRAAESALRAVGHPRRDHFELAPDEHESWILEFEGAIGPNIGTQHERRAFGARLLETLPRAKMVGMRVQATVDDAPKLERLTRTARDAFKALVDEIFADENILFAIKLHSKAEFSIVRERIEEDVSIDLDTIMLYLDRLTDLAREAAEGAPVRRRGRKNTTHSALTTTIAQEYQRHFAKWPGNSDRGSDKRRTPYHRVCDVVERLFESTSNPIQLSDVARAAGIAIAKAKWREKHPDT